MAERKLSFFNRKLTELPRYGLIYFGHVKGEYTLLAPAITDEGDKKNLVEIFGKEDSGALRWEDVYTFELTLLKYRDAENLKSKLQTLRSHYRSVAGEKEFETYLASELTTTIKEQEVEALRADLRHLLDRFFITYSFISARERLRKWLLVWAASLMFVLFIVLAAIVGIATMGADGRTNYQLPFRINSLAVVIFAGVMGAFISMQQRLQAASVEGDVIYNLSTLTHGWFSIFISPLSGAVFAVILYLFFAGQVLSGTVFPTMMTPDASGNCVVAPPTPVPTPLPSPSSAPSPTPTPSSQASPSPEASASATAQRSPAQQQSPTQTPTPIATVTPSPSPSPGKKSIELTEFVLCTGPATGVSYALLVIWCFIAGFAERFVPDALGRLVANNQQGAQKNQPAAPPTPTGKAASDQSKKKDKSEEENKE